MLKVICIDASNITWQGLKPLNEGDVYTVLEEFVLLDTLYYRLFDDDGYYMSDRFIPLSDGEEVEAVEAEISEIQTA